MKNLKLPEIDKYRDCGTAILNHYGWAGDENGGAFMLASPIDNAPMRVVASTGGGWDHVSVSRHNRCPNWYEMEHVKRLFFRPEETAFELHVPESDHISRHPNCLHLWRPRGQEIPLPPKVMV